jgi:hypothetical protein
MLINNLRQIRVIGKIFGTPGCGAGDACGESGDHPGNYAERGAESRNVRELA